MMHNKPMVMIVTGSCDDESQKRVEELLRILRNHTEGSKLSGIVVQSEFREVDRASGDFVVRRNHHWPISSIQIQAPKFDDDTSPWGYGKPAAKINGKRKRNPDRWRQKPTNS